MPDSTANYLTTDANGNVSAEFSGFVYANGLSLIAADSIASYDSNHTVVWTKDTKTGAVVAYIKGAAVPPNGDPATLEMGVVSPVNARNAYIRPTVVDNPGAPNDNLNRVDIGVNGFTGSRSAKLLDGTGASNFIRTSNLQLALPLNRTSGGDVTGNFTLPTASRVLIVTHGTGYVLGAGTAYIDNYVDGSYQGSTPFFFNTAGVHMAMPMWAWVGTLAAGNHSVRMAPGAGITRNADDYNTAVVVATPTDTATQF